MTLKLVSNVTELGIRNWRDVPGQARAFADDIEAGAYGDVSKVIAILDTPGGQHIVSWGDGMSQYEALGMLEVAKLTNVLSLLAADDD